jgi:hypothetical protein
MHVEGENYDKKLLAPLYSRSDAKVVIGDAFGLHNRYNTLLSIFRANIATSAGNLDAIREGIVNLMIYSH